MERRGRNGSVTAKRHPRWSLVAALLAVFCQIVATAAMPSAAWGGASGLQELQVLNAPICHGGDGGGAPAEPAHHHGAGDCALCPICQSLAGSAGGLMAPPVVAVEPPAPVSLGDIGFPSRDPDRPDFTAARHQPRAPPPLV
jgi:hypothetical protein